MSENTFTVEYTDDVVYSVLVITANDAKIAEEKLIRE